MCNLYDIAPLPRRLRAARTDERIRETLAGLPLLYNLRKTEPGLVIRRAADGWDPVLMRWGFQRDFNAAINNTRSDKLEGPMWREAFRQRRCVIPVAAYYEWTGPEGRKETHAMRRKDGDCLWAAGVWEPGNGGGPAYSMITTDAAAWSRSIHDRMPAFLHEEEVDAWLQEDSPLGRIRSWEEDMETFPCENPLKTKTRQAPVPVPIQGMLF